MRKLHLLLGFVRAFCMFMPDNRDIQTENKKKVTTMYSSQLQGQQSHSNSRQKEKKFETERKTFSRDFVKICQSRNIAAAPPKYTLFTEDL